MSPKNNSKDVKEEPEYTGDFGQKKKSSQTFKDYCQSQKNQTSQVNDFSVFLCMGRDKSLGSLK